MAKKQIQQDPGITSIQKLITLCMLAFMGYMLFMQDKHVQRNRQQTLVPPAATIQTEIPQAVKVKITDTDSGDISFSDLSKGKIIIGKWEVELDKPKVEEKTESTPEKPDEVAPTKSKK